jgi:hypothetical protein
MTPALRWRRSMPSSTDDWAWRSPPRVSLPPIISSSSWGRGLPRDPVVSPGTGAVREVEGYRQRHGLLDRDTALGPEAKDRAARREQERVRGSIGLAQRKLGIERVKTFDRARTMEIEL